MAEATAQPNSRFTSSASSKLTQRPRARSRVKWSPQIGSDDGQVQRVAVVDHQVGGLRADVHHGDAFAALFRQHGGVAGGQRLEDGLLDGEMGLVHGAHQRVVLLSVEP